MCNFDIDKSDALNRQSYSDFNATPQSIITLFDDVSLF